MANTGFKQAVIVYKVDAATGAPLDTDGNLIVVDGVPTGRKQAIAVLTGYLNPDPLLYDIELYFDVRDPVYGVPTLELSEDCETGYIFLTPMPAGTVALTTASPTLELVVTSSADWTVTVPAGVAVTPNTGGHGDTSIVLSRSGSGQGNVVFRNTFTGQTVTIYVISVDTLAWILETHAWNMSGIWIDSAIWGA